MKKLKLIIGLIFYSNAFATGYIKNNKHYLIYNDIGNTIECEMQQLCDIALLSNDSFASWIMTDGTVWNDSAKNKVSYFDENNIQHIVIQPTNISEHNNPVILVGNQHQYHFNLKAVKNNKINNYVFIMKPNKEFNQNNAVIDDGANIDFSNKKLDDKYYYRGDTDSEIMPKKVFNDGAKTYIQMPNEIELNDLPIVYTFNNKGNLEQLNNPRYRKPYYIIDGVLKRYALVSGSVDNDNKYRIDIYRGSKPVIKHWFFSNLERN